MNGFYVKICGLTSEAAVAAAVEAGADAVGFVFANSPRAVTPALAARLARGVPPGIDIIAVSRHPSQSLVEEIVATLSPHWLQTDRVDFAALRLPTGLRRLPVLRAGSAPVDPLPDVFLYEGPRSGSGEVADWDTAAALARRGRLLLAGGLHPGNVALAIERVRPVGVDVSSGVEAAPGIKDPALIAQFVNHARAASRNLSGVSP